MRLIDTETGEFVDFVDPKRTPPYAILSHTWDKGGEQTYQEVVKIQEKYRHDVRCQFHIQSSASSEPCSPS